MKLIDSSAELITQKEGLDGVFKHIELCGKTCYKSTDNITETSSKPFIERLIKSKHTSVLEHGTIYLTIPYNDPAKEWYYNQYNKNPYSKAFYWKNKQFGYMLQRSPIFITTNYRVLIENNWLEDLEYLSNPTEHKRRYTVKLITDRGVLAEISRHRAFSLSVESTRYCNYSKSKFNNELTFIKPSWGYIKTVAYVNGVPYNGYCVNEGDYFEEGLKETERTYLKLIEEFNWTPQQARQVLPNALKTEICMTGFEDDWRHFFDLRLKGTTGKPHPDIQNLANKIADVFKENDIMLDYFKE